MELTERARLRECQIEQEHRYERAKKDMVAAQRREEYENRFHIAKKHYPINTNTAEMKRVRRIK